MSLDESGFVLLGPLGDQLLSFSENVQVGGWRGRGGEGNEELGDEQGGQDGGRLEEEREEGEEGVWGG